jgi:hypothetical protein
MTFELILEMGFCAILSNFPHNEKGFLEALNRIELAKKDFDFVSAQIFSPKDGMVFEFSKNFKK